MMKALKAAFVTVLVLVLSIFALKFLSVHQYGVDLGEASEVKAQSTFYYNRLTKEQKKLYDEALTYVDGQPEKIKGFNCSADDVKEAFVALSYDNPRLIGLGSTFKVNSGSFKRNTVSPEYKYTLDEYKQKSEELQTKAEGITASLSADLSDYDKELYIHDWLINNCEYVYTGDYGDEHTAYGAIVNGKATCEGYARAAQLLMYMVGIDNYVVTGDAKTQEEVQRHMWNIVKINGAWYHLDATWDDPISDDGKNYLNHTYFNLTDSEISLTHTVDIQDADKCTQTAENYFVKNNLYFSVYDDDVKNQMANAIAECKNKGGSHIEIKFANKEVFDLATNDLIYNGKLHRLMVIANLSVNGEKLDEKSFVYTTNERLNILSLIF